jgi:hypothetical protein
MERDFSFFTEDAGKAEANRAHKLIKEIRARADTERFHVRCSPKKNNSLTPSTINLIGSNG